jgi:hypothetical protein
MYVFIALAVALQIVLKFMHVHGYRNIIFFTTLLAVLFISQKR